MTTKAIGKGRAVRVRSINMVRKRAACPRCGWAGVRSHKGRRHIAEIGLSGPTVLEVVYSKHYCKQCGKYFSVDMSHLAPDSGRYTRRVRNTARTLVERKGLTLERASGVMRSKYFVRVPPSTIYEWLADEAS